MLYGNKPPGFNNCDSINTTPPSWLALLLVKMNVSGLTRTDALPLFMGFSSGFFLHVCFLHVSFTPTFLKTEDAASATPSSPAHAAAATLVETRGFGVGHPFRASALDLSPSGWCEHRASGVEVGESGVRGRRYGEHGSFAWQLGSAQIPSAFGRYGEGRSPL